MSVNKVILVGNLGKDPEIRYTGAGSAVASFSIATTERYKDRDGNSQENTEWHNIIAWRNLAEICGKYLVKGKQVYIEGKIKTRSYDDRDGIKRYITEIVADQMQMLGRVGDDTGGNRGTTGGGRTAKEARNAPTRGGVDYDEPEFNPDDDIPF